MTSFGIKNFFADLPAIQITQTIVDSGTVLVCGRLNGYNPAIWPTNQVSEMPIVIMYLSGTTLNIDTWSAYVTPGNVRINIASSTNAYTSISTVHSFRYISIPGGVAASPDRGTGMHLYTSDQLRAMPYERVARLLHIPI